MLGSMQIKVLTMTCGSQSSPSATGWYTVGRGGISAAKPARSLQPQCPALGCPAVLSQAPVSFCQSSCPANNGHAGPM